MDKIIGRIQYEWWLAYRNFCIWIWHIRQRHDNRFTAWLNNTFQD